ncbi:hypothetical protein D3C81_1281500 [compost metagenome]
MAMPAWVPAMPLKKIDGESITSTMAKRPSNFSDLLVVNFGQAWAPGMMDFRLLIIWQPLQMPRPKLSVRLKKRANCSARLALNRMVFAQPSPAPSTSPYEKPPTAMTPWKSSSLTRPAIRSLMCTSTAVKPAWCIT